MSTYEYVRSTQDNAQLAASVSKKALESRISQLLASATPLTLSPTHTFPSLQSLAAHLKVAAHQRSFTLEPRFNKTELRLVCTSNKSRDLKGREIYCNAYWEIEFIGHLSSSKLKEGNLRVKLVRAKLDHKHSIENFKIIEGEVNIGVESSDSDSSESESDDELGIVGSSSTEVDTGRRNSKVRTRAVRDVDAVDLSKAVVHVASTKKLIFRSFKSIRSDVENLKASRTLPFPTVANKIWIADHNAFRIYCLASAAQEGITLHLSNDATVAGPTHFRMNCQRSTSSFKTEDRCPYWIKICFVELWSPRYGWIVKEEKVHSQSCIDYRKPHSRMEVVIQSSEISIKQDLDSPSSSFSKPNISSSSSISTTGDDIFPSSRFRISQRSSSLEDNTFSPLYKNLDIKPISPQDIISQPHVAKRPRYRLPLPHPNFNKSPSSNSSSILPSVEIDEDTLAGFLYSISPPLVFYTSLLYSNGLNSQQALLNLISMNELSFDFFLYDLELVDTTETIKKVQKIVFKERIGEVREVLRDGDMV